MSGTWLARESLTFVYQHRLSGVLTPIGALCWRNRGTGARAWCQLPFPPLAKLPLISSIRHWSGPRAQIRGRNLSLYRRYIYFEALLFGFLWDCWHWHRTYAWKEFYLEETGESTTLRLFCEANKKSATIWCQCRLIKDALTRKKSVLLLKFEGEDTCYYYAVKQAEYLFNEAPLTPWKSPLVNWLKSAFRQKLKKGSAKMPVLLRWNGRIMNNSHRKKRHITGAASSKMCNEKTEELMDIIGYIWKQRLKKQH